MLINQWIVGYLRYLIFNPESSLSKLRYDWTYTISSFFIRKTIHCEGSGWTLGHIPIPQIQDDPVLERALSIAIAGRAEMTVVFHGFSVLKEVLRDLQ